MLQEKLSTYLHPSPNHLFLKIRTYADHLNSLDIRRASSTDPCPLQWFCYCFSLEILEAQTVRLAELPLLALVYHLLRRECFSFFYLYSFQRASTHDYPWNCRHRNPHLCTPNAVNADHERL